MFEAARPNATEHHAASVLFATTADTSAFDSPMKYPPCTCHICRDSGPANAEQEQPSETGVSAELRQRVHRVNTVHRRYRLT